MLSRLYALFALGIATVLVAPSWALRFYVDGDPATGDDRRSVQSAQNPETPFRTITHALRIAHLVRQGRPHAISIAEGTYSPSTGETFPLVFADSDIYLETPVLGDPKDRHQKDKVVFDAEGLANFFRLQPSVEDFIIRDIDFFNGLDQQGGVVHCDSCTVAVVDNRFYNNNATQDGHILYARGGRVHFFNNLVHDNGQTDPDIPLLALYNTISDTTQKDHIRNNTFHANPAAPYISTAGNRTDINSNIFTASPGPVIRNASPADEPLVRYNLFWETAEPIYFSDQGDSIGIVRTLLDTTRLPPGPGIILPLYVLRDPDTLATVGQPYEFTIEIRGDQEAYSFTPVDIPAGAAADTLEDEGRLIWTPTDEQVGSHEIEILITQPDDQIAFIIYQVRVFTPEMFPDTTGLAQMDELEITQRDTADTVLALMELDALVSNFATEDDSLGHNLLIDPLYLNFSGLHFETQAGSPGRNAGDPNLPNTPTDPNDIGAQGGPRNARPPVPHDSTFTFSELEITSLPDSVAVEGQPFIYDPAIDAAAKIFLIDLIQGPPSMLAAFGTKPPITWTPTRADTGTYLVGITVFINAQPWEGRHYFSLRVKSSNASPLITSQPDTTAAEDTQYTYQLVATDDDGDPLAFQLTQGPPNMTVSPDGLIQWLPLQEDVGLVQVTVSVSNDQGAVQQQQFALTVQPTKQPTNDPPTIASAPDTVALEDEGYEYALGATDPDIDDILSYRLLVAPQGMDVDSLGVVRWQPDQADVGLHPITVQVLDQSNADTVQTFLLEVVQVDDPPTFTSQPDTTALEDGLYQYLATATDEEGTQLQFALAGPTGMNLVDAQLSWIPLQADVGRHVVTLTATDSSGQSASQAFELVVANVEDQPSIDARSPAAERVEASPGSSLDFSVQASDEDGDDLTYLWLVDGTPLEGADQFALTFAVPQDPVELTVQISDGKTAISALWTVGQLAPNGDFNDDGQVDFNDFFIFAGHFGTDNRQCDLDGNGLVDFTDFFEFAGLFGQPAAKPVPSTPPTAPGALALRLLPPVYGGDPNLIELRLSNSQTSPLRGYVLSFDLAPAQVRFAGYQPPADRQPLTWEVTNTPDQLVLAVGLPAGQPAFAADDLGTLLLNRLESGPSALRASEALIHTTDRTTYSAAVATLELPALPQTFVLYSAYPNPFNPETSLTFFTPYQSPVSLRVFDTLGRPVATLVDRVLNPGFHKTIWTGLDQTGRRVGTGTYLFELKTDRFRQVQKAVLLK